MSYGISSWELRDIPGMELGEASLPELYPSITRVGDEEEDVASPGCHVASKSAP